MSDGTRAFIAANKYIFPVVSDAGRGVVVSYDESIEKKETKRRRCVDSKSVWYGIDIPSPDELLFLEKPVDEQSDFVREHLLSENALQVLFKQAALAASNEANSFAEKAEQDERLIVWKELMAGFYETRRCLVRDLDSGWSLIDFIKGRTKSRDIAVVSSFLWTCGIKGSRYTDERGERVLLFNAREDIRICDIFREKVPDAILVD